VGHVVPRATQRVRRPMGDVHGTHGGLEPPGAHACALATASTLVVREPSSGEICGRAVTLNLGTDGSKSSNPDELMTLVHWHYFWQLACRPHGQPRGSFMVPIKIPPHLPGLSGPHANGLWARGRGSGALAFALVTTSSRLRHRSRGARRIQGIPLGDSSPHYK
jgi:hypothetical protein